MDLLKLMAESPISMGIIGHEVKKAVAKTQVDLEGRSDVAKEAAALQLTYDALDMLVGFPGPVDGIMKAYVIPHIPALIEWAVNEFKKVGWPHEKA